MAVRSDCWWKTSQLFEVAKGVLVPTASLDDVIRMKEAADRVKDHLALHGDMCSWLGYWWWTP